MWELQLLSHDSVFANGFSMFWVVKTCNIY